jgi:hypothetical protein
MIKRTKKTKNKILAIPALAAAMPVNPNKAATKEMMKKTNAQYNMLSPPF